MIVTTDSDDISRRTRRDIFDRLKENRAAVMQKRYKRIPSISMELLKEAIATSAYLTHLACWHTGKLEHRHIGILTGILIYWHTWHTCHAGILGILTHWHIGIITGILIY